MGKFPPGYRPHKHEDYDTWEEIILAKLHRLRGTAAALFRRFLNLFPWHDKFQI